MTGQPENSDEIEQDELFRLFGGNHLEPRRRLPNPNCSELINPFLAPIPVQL
jgi:hypothetical protein